MPTSASKSVASQTNGNGKLHCHSNCEQHYQHCHPVRNQAHETAANSFIPSFLRCCASWAYPPRQPRISSSAPRLVSSKPPRVSAAPSRSFYRLGRYSDSKLRKLAILQFPILSDTCANDTAFSAAGAASVSQLLAFGYGAHRPRMLPGSVDGHSVSPASVALFLTDDGSQRQHLKEWVHNLTSPSVQYLQGLTSLVRELLLGVTTIITQLMAADMPTPMRRQANFMYDSAEYQQCADLLKFCLAQSSGIRRLKQPGATGKLLVPGFGTGASQLRPKYGACSMYASFALFHAWLLCRWWKLLAKVYRKLRLPDQELEVYDLALQECLVVPGMRYGTLP